MAGFLSKKLLLLPQETFTGYLRTNAGMDTITLNPGIYLAYIQGAGGESGERGETFGAQWTGSQGGSGGTGGYGVFKITIPTRCQVDCVVGEGGKYGMYGTAITWRGRGGGPGNLGDNGAGRAGWGGNSGQPTYVSIDYYYQNRTKDARIEPYDAGTDSWAEVGYSGACCVAVGGGGGGGGAGSATNNRRYDNGGAGGGGGGTVLVETNGGWVNPRGVDGKNGRDATTNSTAGVAGENGLLTQAWHYDVKSGPGGNGSGGNGGASGSGLGAGGASGGGGPGNNNRGSGGGGGGGAPGWRAHGGESSFYNAYPSYSSTANATNYSVFNDSSHAPDGSIVPASDSTAVYGQGGPSRGLTTGQTRYGADGWIKIVKVD